jgi:hypothetical protein
MGQMAIPRAVGACMLVAIVAVAFSAGCRTKEDPDAPFRMSLNGTTYQSGLSEPQAYLDEAEAGFGSSEVCTILFPLKALKNRPQPGLEISFDPDQVPIGEEFVPDFDGGRRWIRVVYYPLPSGVYRDGRVMEYSMRGEGSAQILIDDLDLDARHIAGVIVEADLEGAWIGPDGYEIEPEKPMHMHLSNFPFDVPIRDGSPL